MTSRHSSNVSRQKIYSLAIQKIPRETELIADQAAFRHSTNVRNGLSQEENRKSILSCCPAQNVNPYDNTISCQTGFRNSGRQISIWSLTWTHRSVDRWNACFPFLHARALATSPNDLGSSPAIRSHATITRRFIRCSICKRVVEAVTPRPETWH